MPDAIITATESTFGTISGTFSADQSTVTGTVSGVITGTLDGSVGVPGPAGPGVPVGGTAGQFLTKIDGTNYNTDWTTVNLSAYAVKANNLSDLTSAPDARTNLGLGSLAVINDAPSDGSQYARRNAAWEAVAASGASVTISATAPVSPSSGDLWLRTTDYRTFTWTGAEWVESSAGYVSEIGSTFETVSKNLNAYPATLAYSSGLLASITYALGGGLTIVKTFNYTGADLTSIVLSGYTPGGISLTKTLTYSSGVLVGITYS